MGLRQTSVRSQYDRSRLKTFTGDMTPRMFAFAMTSYTVLGLVWTGICASFTDDMTFGAWWHYLVFVLVMFTIALIGVAVSVTGESTGWSLTGFAVMASGLGFLLGPTLGYYSSSSILTAIGATTFMVVVLGIVGVIIPVSLEGWWTYLMGALALLIFGQFLVPLMAPLIGYDRLDGNHVLDWITILVFGLWVTFDLNGAFRVMTFTHRNAADAAAAIYLDFLNIFLAILDLFGEAGSATGDWFSDLDFDLGDFIEGTFEVIWAIVSFPFRLLGWIGRAILEIFGLDD